MYYLKLLSPKLNNAAKFGQIGLGILVGISLKEWIKEEKISPEKIRFIGTDNSIKEFPNTLK